MNRCYECESELTLVCQNCNTRPTPAPCDELETVGWLWEYAQYRTDDRGYYGYETVITESNPTDHVSPAEKLRNVRELVTRQNAEAVIAAKDARIAELEQALETEKTLSRGDWACQREMSIKAEALEAKLAATEEENRKLKHDLAIFHKGNVAFEARAVRGVKP